jgi:Zn-dependent protease
VAIGGLVGVLVHEVGHVLAMNALGCGPARIVIIPFLGGAAIPARPASTEFKDVLISLAGPVFGLLAMIPFAALAFATNNGQWFAAAFFVAFINLLNLAPAPPLDGSKAIGPVLARIHPQVERAALMLVGAAAVMWAISRNSWILAFFLGIGVISALRQGPLRPPAMRLTGGQFAISIALYLGSATLCLGALGASLYGMGRDPSLESVAELFRFG